MVLPETLIEDFVSKIGRTGFLHVMLWLCATKLIKKLNFLFIPQRFCGIKPLICIVPAWKAPKKQPDKNWHEIFFCPVFILKNKKIHQPE